MSNGSETKQTIYGWEFHLDNHLILGEDAIMLTDRWLEGEVTFRLVEEDLLRMLALVRGEVEPLANGEILK